MAGKNDSLLRDDSGISLVSALACNQDCSLIYGIGQVKTRPHQPHYLNTWVWIKGDETVYVGAHDDALNSQHSAPIDVTAEGDLVVGIYDSGVYPRIGFYIWTQLAKY